MWMVHIHVYKWPVSGVNTVFFPLTLRCRHWLSMCTRAFKKKKKTFTQNTKLISRSERSAQRPQTKVALIWFEKQLVWFLHTSNYKLSHFDKSVICDSFCFLIYIKLFTFFNMQILTEWVEKTRFAIISLESLIKFIANLNNKQLSFQTQAQKLNSW